MLEATSYCIPSRSSLICVRSKPRQEAFPVQRQELRHINEGGLESGLIQMLCGPMYPFNCDVEQMDRGPDVIPGRNTIHFESVWPGRLRQYQNGSVLEQ